jgi:Putative beta-barrel porin-2, OmpL-like. bbp2
MSVVVRNFWRRFEQMKKGLVILFLMMAIYMAPFREVQAAEAEKPLAPGWLSLDSSVGAMDRGIASGKSSIEGVLGIGIGGYLDTSFTWSSNHPKDPRNISGRYFDKDYKKVVFNDFHLVLDKPEKDWGVGFRISGDFGRTGELLREATLWGKTFHREPSAELRESYITTTIPVGEGIQFKGGLFVTTLGTEILLNPGSYNDQISRSFAFNYAIPIRHLGTLFSYSFLKTLTGTMGVVTGWDNPRDNNGSPSGLLGVNFTPTDSFALASNIIVGPEQTRNTDNARFTWSNVATIKPMDPLTLLLEFTFGFEQDASTPTGIKDAEWYAFAAVGSWSWTDRFSTALRTELFLDEGASRTQGLGATSPIFNAALGEVTLAATYKFTKMLQGRAELRQDWANRPVYKRGSSNADSNQTTLAWQLLYQY